jgi:hypothetical protein
MLLASSLPALASTAPETAPAFRPVMLERSGSVLVRSLPAHSAAATHGTRPFLRLTPGGAVARRANAIGVTTLPASPLATSDVENVVTAFPAISLDRQLALGIDQFVTPPDTQVAAGPNHLVEMVNSSGSVWDKSGTLIKLFDLNAFFAVPTGYSFSDPRILYDGGSQRWFASGVAFVQPTLASVVTIAVSQTSDPTGIWVQYSAANSSNLTHDQPKIGVSSDKVVLSWNDFLFGLSFQGQSTWVLQKSQMVAGTPANGVAIGPDSTRQSLVPAVQLTSNSAEYIVYNRGASVGVVTITGTPLLGNVVWNESDPAAPTTSAPPTADQPGMPGSIATNDDRFLTAVWENGILWTGGNDACVPSSDTTSRPCSRLIQVFTSTATINQEFDIATTGGGLYFPAFALDGNGDMYVVYNISSSTQYVGVRITGQLAGASAQTLAAAQTIRSGDTTYNMNPCFGTTGTSRWGDYAGAAIDPQNPTDVWVASEYAAIGTSTNPSTAGCAWGTFAARLTFAVTVVPDFTLSATPTSQTVTQGASTTYTVSVTPSNGFNGTVTFSLSGQSADSTYSFNPSSVTTSGSSTLTVTTSSTTPSGTYPLTITGTSSTLSRTAIVSLVVNAAPTPDFALSATPTSQTVTQGASTTYTVSVTPSNGFNGTVTFSLSGQSADTTYSFSPSSVTTSGSSTLTVTTSSTTPSGTYPLTITGVSSSLSHSAAVTLVVQAAPKPDFSLSATPASQTVKHGAVGSYTVSITRTGGFTGAVTLSAGGLPIGVSVGFNPNGTTGNSSTMSVSTSGRTPRGTYVLTITAVSGSLSHSTNVTLVVR